MKRFALLALPLLIGCSGAADDVVDAHDLGAPADLSVDTPRDLTYVDFGLCGDPARNGNEKGGTCARGVAGTLVDDNGTGIGNQALITVCANVCYYGATGMAADDGNFGVAIGHDIVLDNYTLEVHGRPNRASYYLHLPPLVGDQMKYAMPVIDPSLPASGPMIAMDGSAQTITSGDVTMIMPANTSVTIDPEDVLIPDNVGMELRALTIKDPTQLQFVDAASPSSALFAFEPFEVMFSQKVQFSFANTANLPASSAVDVFAMRSLLIETPPAGAFEKVAKAHVSADGKSIAMDNGEGVTWVTWFALRPGT